MDDLPTTRLTALMLVLAACTIGIVLLLPAESAAVALLAMALFGGAAMSWVLYPHPVEETEEFLASLREDGSARH